MVNFILMLLMAFQNVSGVELDFGKIYSILTDRCTQCGNESPDVNVLDLSGQELDDISDIQCLLVRKNDKVTMLKNVENLYLKLNNAYNQQNGYYYHEVVEIYKPGALNQTLVGNFQEP